MRRALLFLKDIINVMNKIFNYTENMEKEEFKKDNRTIDAVKNKHSHCNNWVKQLCDYACYFCLYYE